MKIKLTLADRLKAIDLLANGKSIRQVVQAIMIKHPSLTEEEAKHLYFPATGVFAIHKLEGKPKQEAEKFRKRMIAAFDLLQSEENSRRAKERLERLWEDPNFVKAAKKRSRLAMTENNLDPKFTKKRLAGIAEFFTPKQRKAWGKQLSDLHKDPKFAKANRRRTIKRNIRNSDKSRKEMKQRNKDPDFVARRRQGSKRYFTKKKRREYAQRMKKRFDDPKFAQKIRDRLAKENKDPVFQEKRLAGIARYWNSYRIKMQDALGDMGIDVSRPVIKTKRGGHWRQVAARGTPDRIAMAKERREVIRLALDALSETERAVISLSYLEASKTVNSVKDIAAILEITEGEVKRLSASALRQLSTHRELWELI